MNKYDNMLAVNRERSREKIANAKIAIWKMMEDGERVSVPKLTKLTGLSRGFFYKNAEVRRELDYAIQQQADIINSESKVLREVADNRVDYLQSQLVRLKQENAELKKENTKLHKALAGRV